MKLTNREIFGARDPITTLMKEKLPVKCGFRLAKLANKLNVHLKDIEDVKNGLVRKYGAPNEKGKLQVKEGTPEFEKFAEEFEELMSIEVEIVAERVALPADLSIEPNVLMALEKFIEV